MSLSTSEFDQKVETCLKQMTLEEKCALLSGKDRWSTVAIERLGIPSIKMTDGPVGVRHSMPNVGRPMPVTAFPAGIAMGATWSPALIEEVAAVLADEAHAYGFDILLGPCVNIVRSPLGGRNFESFGEDPYLNGKIAIRYVRGVQSRRVAASLKHFVANNQEFERHRGSSEVDERTLREIYMPHFEMTVKEAQPWTVMNSYNRLNGTYTSENRWLLTDVLRDEWGFEGLVVSDWDACHSTCESVAAGMDLEMPGPALWLGKLLEHSVKIWKIDETKVDEAARRVLRLLAQVGKLGDTTEKMPGEASTPAHCALAQKVAEESMVLLKNDRAVLPIQPDQVQKLAVIGPFAAQMVTGGGGSSFVDPLHPVSVVEGLVQGCGGQVKIAYEPGCSEQPGAKIDPEMLERAVLLAKNSDAAVLVLGLPQGFESESYDRLLYDGYRGPMVNTTDVPNDMKLTGGQDELVRAVAAVNPNTIVVLNVGAPVEMPWVNQVPAILLAHLPGQEGGTAIANLLLGKVNPSGKLTETLPVQLSDNPAFAYYPGKEKAIYGEGIFVGYRHYEKNQVKPLFPFGHGLSYTSFEYNNLLAPAIAQAGDTISVQVQVGNRGERAGKEVVQLYVRDVEASLPRPVKELKGFEKVELQPGESQTLTFTLDARAFAFWSVEKHDWVVEPGEYEILVGASSADIRQKQTLILR